MRSSSAKRGLVTEQAWLIDKSALARLSQSSELEFWSNRVGRGLVHISNVTRLEIGYSAQSGDAARRQFAESPLAAMPVEYLTPKIEDRGRSKSRFCWLIEAFIAGRPFPTF